jgi:hypothetical protein
MIPLIVLHDAWQLLFSQNADIQFETRVGLKTSPNHMEKLIHPGNTMSLRWPLFLKKHLRFLEIVTITYCVDKDCHAATRHALQHQARAQESRLLLLRNISRSPSTIYLFYCAEQIFLDFTTTCLLFIPGVRHLNEGCLLHSFVPWRQLI